MRPWTGLPDRGSYYPFDYYPYYPFNYYPFNGTFPTSVKGPGGFVG